MQNEIDQAYYLRRVREERERAERATDPCAAQVHRDLAREYALKVGMTAPKA